jgi:hypothetical protein
MRPPTWLNSLPFGESDDEGFACSMLRKGLPAQGDTNTITNFAMRARRGHHRRRDEGDFGTSHWQLYDNDTPVIVRR